MQNYHRDFLKNCAFFEYYSLLMTGDGEVSFVLRVVEECHILLPLLSWLGWACGTQRAGRVGCDKQGVWDVKGEV